MHTTPPSLQRPGDILGGRYVLIEYLGEGQSGLVFRARDKKGDREVAVKIFHEPAQGFRETTVAMEATHPFLSRGLDFGRVQGDRYLVLELAKGEAPDVVIRPLDVEGTAMLAAQLLSALSFLHARGYIHGDLKPDNVRTVEEQGRIQTKLIDMGLVSPIGGTAAGGTLLYAAPEALSEATVDARTDLFSLGVMLYEIIEGKLPFGDPNDPNYTSRVLTETIDPLRESIPEAFRAFILRLLSVEADRRYPSAADAYSALFDCDLPLEPALAGTETIEPRLIERNDALSVVSEVCESTLYGGTGRMRIRGDRGVGLTRFLKRAALEATRLGYHAVYLQATRSGVDLARDLLEQASFGSTHSHLATATEKLDKAVRGEEQTMAALLSASDAISEFTKKQPLFVVVDNASSLPRDAREALSFLSRGNARIVWAAGIERSSESEAFELGENTVGVDLAPLSLEGAKEAILSVLPALVERDTVAKMLHAASSGGIL